MVRQRRFALAEFYGLRARPFLELLVCRQLAREAEDDRERAVIYRSLALNHAKRLDHDGATEWWKRHDAIAGTSSESDYHAAIMKRGLSLMHEKKYSEALQQFESALALAQRRGDKPGMAYSLHNIGFAHHRAGRLDAAEQWYKQALVAESALPQIWTAGQGLQHDLLLIAGTIGSLEMLYAKIGRYEEALPKLVEGWFRYARAGSRNAEKIKPWLKKVRSHFGEEEYDRRVGEIESELERNLSITIGRSSGGSGNTCSPSGE